MNVIGVNERTKNMKLIIQIPCYNEAETLEVTLNDLPKKIEGIDEIEYLIINDGSTDKTVEVALNWGVHYVVNFTRNKGLAKGFVAGLDACLHYGADIIVNTDADNQYCGEDIEKLVRPILEGKADIVIGERPIDTTEHFSPVKKLLQHFGSWVVRQASQTNIPDAPSGFRAFSREAALRTNVINEYTYTLETIVQAGKNKMSIMSVPIKTNPELRKSRLFHSTSSYVKKSIITIIRSFLMYRPMKFFSFLGIVPILLGAAIGVRFLVNIWMGNPVGYIQSLILGSTLIILGFITMVIGFQADVTAANRKILEEIQYKIRKIDCVLLKNDQMQSNTKINQMMDRASAFDEWQNEIELKTYAHKVG
jgi:glycosyltransferase involved in cell wall biosynthesis